MVVGRRTDDGEVSVKTNLAEGKRRPITKGRQPRPSGLSGFLLGASLQSLEWVVRRTMASGAKDAEEGGETRNTGDEGLGEPEVCREPGSGGMMRNAWSVQRCCLLV
jgi:hypothetical protein